MAKKKKKEAPAEPSLPPEPPEQEEKAIDKSTELPKNVLQRWRDRRNARRQK